MGCKKWFKRLSSLSCSSLIFIASITSATDNNPYVEGLKAYSRQDYQAALRYWLPLAVINDCDALNSLGSMYLQQQGVRQDAKKAIELWTRSAKLGDSNAQLALADIYLQQVFTRYTFCSRHDCGIRQDYATAYKWYSIVERTSNNEAMRRYASHAIIYMLNSMTAEQVENINLLITQWKTPEKNCPVREYKLIDYGKSI